MRHGHLNHRAFTSLRANSPSVTHPESKRQGPWSPRLRPRSVPGPDLQSRRRLRLARLRDHGQAAGHGPLPQPLASFARSAASASSSSAAIGTSPEISSRLRPDGSGRTSVRGQLDGDGGHGRGRRRDQLDDLRRRDRVAVVRVVQQEPAARGAEQHDREPPGGQQLPQPDPASGRGRRLAAAQGVGAIADLAAGGRARGLAAAARVAGSYPGDQPEGLGGEHQADQAPAVLHVGVLGHQALARPGPAVMRRLRRRRRDPATVVATCRGCWPS